MQILFHFESTLFATVQDARCQAFHVLSTLEFGLVFQLTNHDHILALQMKLLSVEILVAAQRYRLDTSEYLENKNIILAPNIQHFIKIKSNLMKHNKKFLIVCLLLKTMASKLNIFLYYWKSVHITFIRIPFKSYMYPRASNQFGRDFPRVI